MAVPTAHLCRPALSAGLPHGCRAAPPTARLTPAAHCSGAGQWSTGSQDRCFCAQHADALLQAGLADAQRSSCRQAPLACMVPDRGCGMYSRILQATGASKRTTPALLKGAAWQQQKKLGRRVPGSTSRICDPSPTPNPLLTGPPPLALPARPTPPPHSQCWPAQWAVVLWWRSGCGALPHHPEPGRSSGAGRGDVQRWGRGLAH